MTGQQRRRRLLSARHPALRVRLVAANASAALLLSGTVTALRLDHPVPVSAQVILQRAAHAMALPGLDRVVHHVSQFHFGPHSAFGLSEHVIASGPVTLAPLCTS